MLLKNRPIQRKLMTVILLTSGAVLLLTCSAFFAYEFFTFRQATITQLSTLGEIIATNSTAALAFGDRDNANEILAALKAEKHIAAAGLYDREGNLFSQYPQGLPAGTFPLKPDSGGYRFEHSYLVGFQSVVQRERNLGTLYLKADMGAIYERFQRYGVIVALVIALSFLLAYLLSRRLQKKISKPILALAETAKAISDRHDYSVRATKSDDDELGLLTDAFNHMLIQIEEQNGEITLFNQKLEQKVIERTREIEIANKELEAFSYSVSHDLRAPLRSIHGYMNIFHEEYSDKFDDEARRLINIILKNAKKMGQLIDDLLAFSRLGRKELAKQTISMKDMVRHVWEEQEQLAGDRHIELVLKEIPEAYVDTATIRQLWVYLVSNAMKYTRHKEKAIVEIGSEEEEDKLTYYIKDNGAGFDMRYYDKLFGVFQRLHTDKEFEGTGVGLAIVQRIISKHGGAIWAEARPNEGATFFFSLSKSPG